MNNGDKVYLITGSKPVACTVVHDYTHDQPPFDAVSIERGSELWIVKPNEITPAETHETQQRHLFLSDPLVEKMVAICDSKTITLPELADKMGVQMIRILSKARKAHRMGLLHLSVRVKKPKDNGSKPTNAGDPQQQMSYLRT